MNYYRRYVGDFQAATMALSMMEQGAYDRLLDHYYATEKPIPPNSDRAAMICRAITLEERAAVQLVLESYFERGPDGWRHKRVEKEIALSRQRSKAGKDGAASRWQSDSDANEDGKQHADSMQNRCPPIPTTNHQPPSANHQPPQVARPRRAPRKAGAEAPTAKTWDAYSEAYRQRYGIEPTRNRTVNAQLAQFVERVPIAEAPQIAAWFLRSNRQFYVTRKHTVGVMLSDAEALRTEWLTGRQSSDTEARQADRAMATGNAFAPLLEEAREREEQA